MPPARATMGLKPVIRSGRLRVFQLTDNAGNDVLNLKHPQAPRMG